MFIIQTIGSVLFLAGRLTDQPARTYNRPTDPSIPLHRSYPQCMGLTPGRLTPQNPSLGGFSPIKNNYDFIVVNFFYRPSAEFLIGGDSQWPGSRTRPFGVRVPGGHEARRRPRRLRPQDHRSPCPCQGYVGDPRFIVVRGFPRVLLRWCSCGCVFFLRAIKLPFRSRTFCRTNLAFCWHIQTRPCFVNPMSRATGFQERMPITGKGIHFVHQAPDNVKQSVLKIAPTHRLLISLLLREVEV